MTFIPTLPTRFHNDIAEIVRDYSLGMPSVDTLRLSQLDERPSRFWVHGVQPSRNPPAMSKGFLAFL